MQHRRGQYPPKDPAHRANATPLKTPHQTKITGTRFVVCAVWGLPVSISTIVSQFPWSAQNQRTPAHRIQRPRHLPQRFIHRFTRGNRRTQNPANAQPYQGLRNSPQSNHTARWLSHHTTHRSPLDRDISGCKS